MTDDAALLRRYLEDRSQAAFSELVERHVHLVYSAALRQVNGDVHRAEDVTQTVFALLARKAHALVDRPVLAGWLYTAARLVARDDLRRERRRRCREQEALAMHDAPVSDTEWEQLKPVIDEALAELDERDREAVLLRFFGGRRFGEIGAVLHLSEDAARMRVDRALERLRLVLARRGVTSTSAALAAALPHAVIAAPAGLAAKVSMAALASAPAVFNLWTLVSTPKVVAGVSTAVAILAVGVGLFQHGEVHRLDAALAREREASRTQIQRASDRVAALERRVQSVPTSAGPGSAAALAPGAGSDAPARATAASRPEPSAEAVARVAAALPLGNATHVAYVMDTSGSMRDPATGSLRAAVVEQVWAIFVAYPRVRQVQILDADGRFILGRAGTWIANEGVTREIIQRALESYSIFSNSDPAPGIIRAMRNLPDAGDSAQAMSVVVLGDEFTGDDEATVAWLDRANPVDAAGRRRFAVSAVGFAAHLPESTQAPAGSAAEKFSRAMRRIATAHGGAFVEAP